MPYLCGQSVVAYAREEAAETPGLCALPGPRGRAVVPCWRGRAVVVYART